MLTLFTYPYMLLTVRAAYRRLDPSLEEASRTLGHGSFSTFIRVVVPQLRPSIAAGSLLVGLYVMSDFGAVSMLRYDTFTRAIYLQYRGGLDRNTAAVLGLILVILTIIVLAAEQRFRGTRIAPPAPRFRCPHGSDDPSRRMALGGLPGVLRPHVARWSSPDGCHRLLAVARGAGR